MGGDEAKEFGTLVNDIKNKSEEANNNLKFL
jgi:hypothetical protein